MSKRLSFAGHQPGALSVAVIAAGVAFQGAGRLAANVLVASLGGITVLGVYAAAFAASQLIAVLWSASAGTAATRYIAQARGRHDARHGNALSGQITRDAVAVTGLISGAGGVVWLLTRDGDVVGALAVVALSMTTGLYSVTRGIAFGAGFGAFGSAVECVAAMLSVGLLALVLLLRPNPYLALTPLVVSALLYFVVVWRGDVRGRTSRRERSEIRRFTLVSMVGSVAGSGFFSLALLAAAVDGAEAAASFSVAIALSTPLALMVMPIGLVLYPSLNVAIGSGNREDIEHQLAFATRALTYGVALAAGLVILLAPWAVSLVWGGEFGSAVRTSTFVVLAVAVGAVSIPAVNLLSGLSVRMAARASAWAIATLMVGVGVWVSGYFMREDVPAAEGLLIGRGIFSVAAIAMALAVVPFSLAATGMRAAVLVLMGAALTRMDSELNAAVAWVALAGCVIVSDPHIRQLLLRRGGA